VPYGYTQPGNWKTTRKRILTRDRYSCYICGAPAVEVDAIVPDSQGGTHADDANLAAICIPDHDAKSAAERRAGNANRPRSKRAPEAHPGLA
jgi:5-methylcytosine-specific restriction endonuclease McrA